MVYLCARDGFYLHFDDCALDIEEIYTAVHLRIETSGCIPVS